MPETTSNEGPQRDSAAGQNNRLHSVLEEFHFCITAALDQLKGEAEPRHVENFCRVSYWKKFDELITSLHKELTMVGVLFTGKSRPDAESMKALTSKVSGRILQLVSLRYGLPKDQGNLLSFVFNSFFLELLTELSTFTDLLMANSDDRIVPQVGRVWELCEQSKTLPKSNADCLSIKIREQLSLVDDALSELNEAQETDSDDDVAEFQAGLPALQAGIGMVKTAKALLTQLHKSVRRNGSVDTESDRREFDTMCSLARETSSHVDEFSLALYPPPDKQEVNIQLEELVQHLRAIFDLYKRSHYLGENADKPLDIIEKALAHNEDKVKRLVT